MSATRQKSPEGHVLTPSGWVKGHVIWQENRIVAIAGTPVTTTGTPEAPYILPGFIDLHVHGGDGVDYSDGEDGIRRFLRFHATRGTVALAPTTGTAPIAVIEQALADIATVRNHRQPNEPTVLGAHLEGPFINPGKLGAQLNLTLEGDVKLALRWAGICPIIIATVAPEIPGGNEVVEALTARGCRVQIGHSLASAEETAAGFRRGLAGFTHLFNGMSGLDHRHPGAATYALAEGRYAELICDLIHVHPAMIRAAARAIPRLYAISDATALAGCPDGEHGIGTDGHVIKTGNMIMLASGKSLAGSAITMLDGFRNLVSLGFSIAEASEMCATRQAEYLNRYDLGRIAPGALASFVVLDHQLDLHSVWVEGRRIERVAD
ncbi:MAG: amidohydrolase family protein [Paracoccaceae bacterium]|nr:amidohydrolase family protein [Paracoccaceae bacterium]